MTTVFNGAGEGSAKASWVLMRRTRADTFRSANRRKNLHRFSMLHVAEPKNRTCIGPHPRTPKKPTISVVERGYVRRSELIAKTAARRLMTPVTRCHHPLRSVRFLSI